MAASAVLFVSASPVAAERDHSKAKQTRSCRANELPPNLQSTSMEQRDAQLVSNDSSLKHTDQQREPAEPSSESAVFHAFCRSAAIWAASSSLFGVGWTWTISGACAVPRRSPGGLALWVSSLHLAHGPAAEGLKNRTRPTTSRVTKHLDENPRRRGPKREAVTRYADHDEEASSK